jgi:hypothetical protein
MSWPKYTVVELRNFANIHNNLVKIHHPSKLNKAELIKELDLHFSWKDDGRLEHKTSKRLFRFVKAIKQRKGASSVKKYTHKGGKRYHLRYTKKHRL